MKLKLVNFLCYTDSTFEFGDNGLTLINGPSGVGKTSLMRAIFFALFGDGTKVQSYGKASCSVELEFDGLKIVRSKKPNRLIVNEVYEDESAQSIINKKFGDTFKTSGYIQQNNLNSFILLSPPDKLIFLEKFAFHEIDLAHIKNRCKSHINNIHDELTVTISELNLSREFLKDTNIPIKVNFPIKCNKSQIEKVIKNEVIRHKNCFTLISQTQKNKENKENALSDLRILNATLQSQRENLNNITEKLVVFNNRKESIIYKGNDYLSSLEEKLSIILMSRDFNIMSLQYTEDVEKLRILREQELNDFQIEILSLSKDIWNEYTKDDIKNTITDLESCIVDIQRVEHLKKYNKLNEINKIELDNKKTNLDEYYLSIEEKKELYRKIISQKAVYTCPKCEAHVSLINENLILYEDNIENFDEQDSEQLLDEINELSTKIKKIERVIPDEENKLNTITKNKEEIKEILNKYEEEHTLSSLQEDIKYLQDYRSTEVQKEKLIEKLTENIELEKLSRSYNTCKSNIEKLKEKLKENSTNSVIEESEEQIRVEIFNQKQNKSQLESISQDIENLEKEKKYCLNILEKEEQNYINKYDIKYDEDTMVNDINIYIKKIEELECKKSGHATNITQIDDWKKYTEEQIKYTKLKNKVKELEIKEKEDRSRYSAALTLKDNILEAESISISNIIETINMHARTYLDCFFEDNPISVQLQAFKETKKSTKPCINVVIEYKGMECDLMMLSGGELARVVLSYTLALSEIFNTPLLLLDECTASLDQDLTSDVFDGIREHFGGKLVLIIAHQVVAGTFDKVIKL